MEVWKEIPGYEGFYEASDYGQIRSMDHRVPCKGNKTRLVKGRIKKLQVNKNGYYITTLSKENVLSTFTVHQLIALTFMPNFSKSDHLNHIDGNKLNNALSNLEPSNPSHNGLHAHRLGLIKPKKVSVYRHVSYISNPRAKSRWAACITHAGKSCYGWKTFMTELEAAIYVDQLLDSIGDTQRLRNFP